MILHTLNASPATAAYRDCLALLQPGDALVLLGDGVYAGIAGCTACTELLATGVEVFALATDVQLAGITASPGIEVIDMEKLVELSAQFPRQQAWY